ncbi:MAG: Multi-sensor signal transduction histidine kinase [Parcubacteria group bacterium GW2011_GWC1_45_9]|nr:MAG: Multi-sensor signal transduction histidine kinase [Parcubacteria group bacterium GW2011_GWB1_45_10]KKU17352.1 MAG: Multi-sensor signal transduction histidine kinase [Parcubacteria group bacterium GW2011_GWC1_45_9]
MEKPLLHWSVRLVMAFSVLIGIIFVVLGVVELYFWRHWALGALALVSGFLIFGNLLLLSSLIRGKNHLNAVVFSMGEGLIEVDTRFRIVSFNPMAQKILSASPGQLLNKDIRSVINAFENNAKVAERDHPIVKAIGTGLKVVADLDKDLYFEDFNGRRFPVILSSSPIVLEDKIIGGVIVFRDSTEEKRFEEAESNFIATASHQLRTPLTSMRWFSEMLLLGDVGKLTKKQSHFLERVYQGAERMIKLIGLLLQVARSEAGKIRIEPVLTDIKEAVENLVRDASAKAEEKRQEIEITAEPSPFPKLAVDQEIFSIVVRNLLDNAITYSSKPGKIIISLSKNKDEVEISVKDEGIGIPKKSQEHIFEKFFRADNALAYSPDGWGLSLSLAKYLVEAWGGKIWCVSEVDKGAEFLFTIPESGMQVREGWARLNE